MASPRSAAATGASYILAIAGCLHDCLFDSKYRSLIVTLNVQYNKFQIVCRPNGTYDILYSLIKNSNIKTASSKPAEYSTRPKKTRICA